MPGYLRTQPFGFRMSRSASASGRYHRLAAQIAGFAAPSAPSELNPLCESARLVRERHGAFMRYLHTASRRDSEEAIDYLAILVAFLQGKAGQGWNEATVRESAKALYHRVRADAVSFLVEYREHMNRMLEDIDAYRRATCRCDAGPQSNV